MTESEPPGDGAPKPEVVRKPRVIGGDLVRTANAAAVPRGPRAIGSAGGGPAQVPPPNPVPRVVPSAARGPGAVTVAAAPAVAAAAVPHSPRPMPGQIRVGLKVRADELARRFPEQPPAIIDASVRVLGGVTPSGFGRLQAQDLGIDVQRQYGVLVQRLLDVSSADVLRSAPQHLSRLLSLLEACAKDFEPAPSVVSRWLGKNDKPKALDEHRHEIEQLKTRLAACIADLGLPIAQVSDLRAQLGALIESLIAAGLACEWLAEMPGVGTEVQSVLAERMLSLTKTAAIARQQQAQFLATANHIDALRDRIQEGVLIALPSWLANLASRPPTFNDTQRFLVRDDLRQIIDRLRH